jgi:hypothetical protein
VAANRTDAFYPPNCTAPINGRYPLTGTNRKRPLIEAALGAVHRDLPNATRLAIASSPARAGEGFRRSTVPTATRVILNVAVVFRKQPPISHLCVLLMNRP